MQAVDNCTHRHLMRGNVTLAPKAQRLCGWCIQFAPREQESSVVQAAGDSTHQNSTATATKVQNKAWWMTASTSRCHMFVLTHLVCSSAS